MRVEPLAPFVIPAVRPVLSSGSVFSIRPSGDPVFASASAACEPSRAGVWARAARLGPRDLTMAVEVPAQHGVARFNVADAGGYHGARKCNLFALEIAHRAGFAVPIVARPHGVGFPGADGMARQVGEGKAGSWATVADGWAPGTLGACRARGGCMLAVTSAPGRAQGHVVVVDRVDEISRGENGGIRRLRVTGWDAGARGARYRSVTLAAIGSGGRFDEIHLVALRPGKHAIWTGDASPGASVLDLLRA